VIEELKWGENIPKPWYVFVLGWEEVRLITYFYPLLLYYARPKTKNISLG